MLDASPDAVPDPVLLRRAESGGQFAYQVWRFAPAVRAIASGVVGGGIGARDWLINATVRRDYDRLDPDVHLGELAAGAGLTGAGVGLLTAVDVGDARWGSDGGVRAMATVGLGHPTWAAAPPAVGGSPAVGTVNIAVFVPVLLSDAALTNAVITVTEAKVQALVEQRVDASGTASDAVFVGCVARGAPEPFGGPRSLWGARIARAVHAAVASGIVEWSKRFAP